jgi:adenine-specific DNA-methyltransferase
VVLLHELLTDTGSIYVHCDWRVNSYIRAILDEVFGADNFRNEIIWRRSTSHSYAHRYGQVHDSIYWFTKGSDYPWEPQYRAYSQEYIDRYFRFRESDGRRYWKEDATGAGPGPPRKFGGKLISPAAVALDTRKD